MAKIDATTLTHSNLPRTLGLTLEPGDYLVWDEIAPMPAGLDACEVSDMERHLAKRGLRTFTHGVGLVVVSSDHDIHTDPYIAD